MTFSKEQPQTGDSILHCGHLGQDTDAAPPANWFKFDGIVAFQRPDGSHGEAGWFVFCAACYLKFQRCDELHARGDGRWSSDKMRN